MIVMGQIEQGRHQPDGQRFASDRTEANPLADRRRTEQVVDHHHPPRLGGAREKPRKICFDVLLGHLSGQNRHRVVWVDHVAQSGPEEIRGHRRLNPWVLSLFP